MSLTKQHFEVIAKLIVFLETKEFATKQDIKAFVKTELRRFCFDHGDNFNGYTFDSYITNHIQKALKEKKENGLIKLSDTISHLIPNQS